MARFPSGRLDRFHLLILDDLAYVTKDQAETQRCYSSLSPATSAGPCSSPPTSRSANGAAIDRLVHHFAVFEIDIKSTRTRGLLSLFPAICFPRKRTARLSPAVQVREETPRGRQRQRGVGSHRVSYFANPRAPRSDEARFSAHVSRATVRIAADRSAGHGRLVPEGMLRIASHKKRPCVSASASPSMAVILRLNTIEIAQFAAVRWPGGISIRDRPIG
jgi:hypothetical protein